MKAKRIKIDVSVIFVLFFCIIFIYQYVDGAINIITRNKLEENGNKVLVTVTDAEYVTGGENDYYQYTMKYEYNGQHYTYIDSSDHDWEVGEQLTMYVDPNEPEKLHLHKDSMYLSFLMLALGIGSMYLSDKFQFLKRNIMTLISVAEIFIIVTGIALKHIPLVIVGIILILLTSLFMHVLKKKKEKVFI